MGKLYLKYLDGANIYACSNCKAHLALHDDIISKNFHGRHGKAYLFNRAVNVLSGPSEERSLMTGLHIVCDIYCLGCSSIVGWKYEDAYEESQKYKVGKYILEKAKLSKVNGWQQDLQSQMEHSSDEETTINRTEQQAQQEEEEEDEEQESQSSIRQPSIQSIRRLITVRSNPTNPTSRFIQQVLRTGSNMEDDDDDSSDNSP